MLFNRCQILKNSNNTTNLNFKLLSETNVLDSKEAINFMEDLLIKDDSKFELDNDEFIIKFMKFLENNNYK